MQSLLHCFSKVLLDLWFRYLWFGKYLRTYELSSQSTFRWLFAETRIHYMIAEVRQGKTLLIYEWNCDSMQWSSTGPSSRTWVKLKWYLKYLRISYHLSPLLLCFRSDKWPIPYPLHGRFAWPILCRKDDNLYPVNLSMSHAATHSIVLDIEEFVQQPHFSNISR